MNEDLRSPELAAATDHRRLGLAPHLAHALAECYGIDLATLDLLEQGRWVHMAQLAIDFVDRDNTLPDAALDLEGRLRERLAALEAWLATAPTKPKPKTAEQGEYRSMDNAGRQLVTVDGNIGCRWSGPGGMLVGDKVRLHSETDRIIPDVGVVTALATTCPHHLLVTITERV